MVLHETTSPSSTCPLAPACMQSLCLASLRLRSRSSLQDRSGPATTSLPTLSPTTCDLRNPLPSSNEPPGHPRTDSKYIDSYLPGGSLQVAVSEAPCPRSCNCGRLRDGRFRYSPRTSGELASWRGWPISICGRGHLPLRYARSDSTTPLGQSSVRQHFDLRHLPEP